MSAKPLGLSVPIPTSPPVKYESPFEFNCNLYCSNIISYIYLTMRTCISMNIKIPFPLNALNLAILLLVDCAKTVSR